VKEGRFVMKQLGRKSERGIALAFVGIVLVALFAIIVLAVDIGRYVHTAGEVQAVADLAALSGAKSVLVRGAGTAQSGADTAALQNTFDGRTFVDDGTVASLPVDEGCYTPPAATCSTNCQGTFSATAPPCPAGQYQAVRATATGKDVRAITAGLIGAPLLHDVTKQAIAGIVGINAVAATLPVVICPEVLQQLQPGGTCVQDAVLSQISLVPTPGQNGCYSSLGNGAASSHTFSQLLPPECGGISTGRPVVSVGEFINVQSGADASFLMNLQSCISSGIHDFLIPVVMCGDCTQAREVTDFVTIHIADASQVVATGPAANKGIHNATQVCNNNVPGSSGSVNSGLFASRQVVLVQ
jgi:Flp pilus assembly protein TadG